MAESTNSAAHEQLSEMIRRVQQLETFVEDVAPAVARSLDGEIRRSIDLGQGPDGVPWPKTKDGRTPLRNAAKALTVRAFRTVVLARLTGVEARHHLGAVKGGIKRPILPTKGLPQQATRAITQVVTAKFNATMNGGSR